jgi:hypothetical protein
MKSADLSLMLPMDYFPHVLMQKNSHLITNVSFYVCLVFVVQVRILMSWYKFLFVLYHTFVY